MAENRSDELENTKQTENEDALTAGNPPAQDDKKSPKEPEFLGFTGSFPHSIDAKGRMIIPASFREGLGDRFAVAPSPDFKAVALYPIADWIEQRDMLSALAKRKPVAQPLLDMFTKYSYTDCESDAQGRLLLPARIRAWRLGDVRDVAVNGSDRHIVIIPAQTDREQDRSFDEKFADPLAFITDLMKE